MKKSTFKYLVIEDDKSIWKNISARMQKYLQWKPVPFTDSLQEAITLIDTHRPDLILSEGAMPILSSLIFTRLQDTRLILSFLQVTKGKTPKSLRLSLTNFLWSRNIS